MEFMKQKFSKALALVICLIMTVMSLPMSAFAAVATDLPENMADHAILRALAYTGYNVEKQKSDGTLYKTNSISSRTPASVLSKIHYGTSSSGFETVTDSSTETGLAPNIARFEKSGLCCASFVTYYICNYLPNIEGVNTQFITDAIKATGWNSQSVATWEKAMANLEKAGKIEKIGTNASNVNRSKLSPGDIIIFGNSTDTSVHIAIFSGTYKGEDFIIHVGNERGPEISIARYMAQSGSKSSTPNAYYHFPQDLFEQVGAIEVYKKDTDGKALSGAYFTATNTKTNKKYVIGPTDRLGYAKSGDPIPFGTYKIVETVFPQDYRSYGQSEWTVTIDKNTPNATAAVTAVNEKIPGSCKIVKTSEDGKVDSVSFVLEGNGVKQTVTTKNDGIIQIDNLKPGNYTVTEPTDNKYVPQEVRNVTVVSGGVATVTFNNILKRGNLAVTKTAEDGLHEGTKFRLHGTSLSGLEVDEYAVVGSDGKACFNDVLIGTNFVLEEVDVPSRYVIPESQTADILWNDVTHKTFENTLKKFRADVFKIDSDIGGDTAPTTQSLKSDSIVDELGKPYGEHSGDTTLGGAVYGLYQNGTLIDTYITDRNGYFVTDYYPCSVNGRQATYYIQEISVSEGYLLDPEKYYIDCSAEDYTIELNTEFLDVYEKVITGKIAIVKHSDDGSTKIETPESGATFAVYLKSAGSFNNAKNTERDILVCDENGFADSIYLPYGVYTVQQTKGAAGKELMPAFDVFINSEGEIYRYLINNATFESLIEIVKKDAETGKIIPAAGVGFMVRDVSTGEYVKQHINYPTPIDIDTYYTDITGKLMLPEKLSFGRYEIIEVCVGNGYVLDSTPVPFEVDGSKTVVTVEKYNTAQKGTVTVNKSGEVFYSVTEKDGIYSPVYKTAGLSGSVFEIFADEDIVTLDGTVRAKKGEKVATVKTVNGSATTAPLYLGKYKISEKTAAYGTVLNTEPKYAELTYAGENISVTETSVDFHNERQRAMLNLRKLMETDEVFNIGNNDEILSVQFGLFAAETLTAADGKTIPKDALLEKVMCDKNGNAEFKTDIPVGANLYIKELATDSHYILSDKKYPVAFAYAGQNITLVQLTANNGEVIKNDILYGAVSGLKADRETNKTVSGAMFGLFPESTTELTETNAVCTAVSDENGVFTFAKVPYGKWVIKELQPAENYLPNEEIYPVTVSENGQIIEITVFNDRIPEITTSATVNGEKEMYATETAFLTDSVSYKHLVPGKEYTVKGILMNKSTGMPLLICGKEIISEIVFKPDSSSGEVAVNFEFDSKFIKAETEIVVFETLYTGGSELTSHCDISDKEQTVKICVPRIGTTADIDGKKQATANGEITVKDIVFFENLTAGKEYTVKGIIIDKATGKPFKSDGKEIAAETVFTPETSNGEIAVFFTFATDSICVDTELVVFESIYREGVEIATHSDIEDEGQTVRIVAPKPPVPQTGDNTNLGFLIGLAAFALGGLIAVVIIYFKAKKDDE